MRAAEWNQRWGGLHRLCGSRSTLLSGMVPFRHDSLLLPGRRNRCSTDPSPPGSPAKHSRQGVLGRHSILPAMPEIPSQLGLRQEGRIFSATLPMSLTFLLALWGLQYSIRLDKGSMGTIFSEDIHSPELCSELHKGWIYWAEPLKQNFTYIARNFSPHCGVSCTARQTKAEPWWGSLLGASIPALPHTLTVNKHSYSWEEPANMSALKKPHKHTWTRRASGWNSTVKGALK